MKYHVNGTLVDAEDAAISVRDRGFLYGDAAFETLRAYGGELFAWSAHHRRLEATCDALSIDSVPSGHDLWERIHETLDANNLADAYIRLSITRGVQSGRLAPTNEGASTVVIIVEPLPRGGLNGERVWDGPGTVASVDVQSIPDGAVPSFVKTHNYLHGILARIDADEADEAIILDANECVTEGTISNVFFVDDDMLHTPGLDLDVLPGVTRWAVLELASDLGIPVEEGQYTLEDLYNADELFLTNTTWEIRPIDTFDNESYDTNTVSSRLAHAFADMIESSHY